MRTTSWLLALTLMVAFLAGCSQDTDNALYPALREQWSRTDEPAAPADESSRPEAADWFGMAAQLRQDSQQIDVPADALLGVDADSTDADASAGAKAGGEDGRRYVHWTKRRGPAYPDDILHSFGRDAKEFVPMRWDDTKAVATSKFAWIMFGASGAAGIALSGNRGNDQVARHFTENGSQLNTFWDNVGDVGGNPGLHFALAGAAYFASQANDDVKTYEVSKSMLSALSINGLMTLGLKVAARTESPNGDEFGWPSGHTSSSFCFAAVMYEHYGPAVGLPLYAFASFVGYERIDARNHDFNDVISGAMIGMAVGHVVAGNHQPKVLGMDVLPYTDPRGGVGLLLTREF
jgi:membrane-associated phospholipid phosphatase